jgi:hypothetical protein
MPLSRPPSRHQGKRLAFLLSDGQLKDEAWLEDVNGLLNAGEVPNLFPQDERMQARRGGALGTAVGRGRAHAAGWERAASAAGHRTEGVDGLRRRA